MTRDAHCAWALATVGCTIILAVMVYSVTERRLETDEFKAAVENGMQQESGWGGKRWVKPTTQKTEKE